MAKRTGRNADPKIEELRQASVFSHLAAAELQWVATQMDEIDMPAGSELTVQGRPGHTFYILAEGNADVVIDGKKVATLGAGDFFGEVSMLDRGPATATVTTTVPTRLLVMSHQQFRDAVRGNEEVLGGVLAAMGARLRANQAAGFVRV